MKTLLLIFLIVNNIVYSQIIDIDNKKVVGVFEVPGKDKDELFSSLNKWISLTYNNADNVIDLSDKEAGNIIVKGVNSVSFKNNYKLIYPKNKNMSETMKMGYRHLMEINIKDNKYRVKFEIQEAVGSGEIADFYSNCISFKDINQSCIDQYNIMQDGNLKKGMISKNKRELMADATRPQFEEISRNLMVSIEAIFKNLQSSVLEDINDDW